MTRRRLLDVPLAGALLLLGTPTVVRLVGDHGRTYAVLAAVLIPLAVLPLVVLAGILLALGRKVMATVAAGLVAVNVVWLVPLYVADPPREGQRFTVMTANLRLGDADVEALVREVVEGRVDVLATQELTQEAVTRLRAAGLERALPHSELSPATGAEGAGLWSRYPLRALPVWQLRFAAPGAVVLTPAGEVVVRVVHPFPTNLVSGGSTFRADYKELTRLVEQLDPAVPTVLAGDFNSSRDNSALRRLMGDRFRDASEVAGEGVTRTWSPQVGWIPLLHLDHVLVDEAFDVRSTRVLQVPGSDHRAILAELVLP